MGFIKCGQTMQVLITTTSLQHLVAPAPTTKPLKKNYNLILTFNILCLTKETKIFSYTICGVSLHMTTL